MEILNIPGGILRVEWYTLIPMTFTQLSVCSKHTQKVLHNNHVERIYLFTRI